MYKYCYCSQMKLWVVNGYTHTYNSGHLPKILTDTMEARALICEYFVSNYFILYINGSLQCISVFTVLKGSCGKLMFYIHMFNFGHSPKIVTDTMEARTLSFLL